jgi:hypothetical protein
MNSPKIGTMFCAGVSVELPGGAKMVRLVVVLLIVLCAGLATIQLYRLLKGRGVDWSGIAFAVGFVALAFYLRHATGFG